MIEPPPKLGYNTPQAVWLNRLLEYCKSLQPISTPSFRVSRSSRGVALVGYENESIGGGGASVSRYKVVSVGEDDLTCHSWDGTTAGTEDITVLKPYLLRKTTFNAKTRVVTATTIQASISIAYEYLNPQERKATAGSDIERQAVTPRYLVGDVIYAIGTDEDDPVDLNNDGRQWCRE